MKKKITEAERREARKHISKTSGDRVVVAEYGPLQIKRETLHYGDGRKVEQLTVVVDPEWLKVADRQVNLTLQGEFILPAPGAMIGSEVSEEMLCPLAFVAEENDDVVLYALDDVPIPDGRRGSAHKPVVAVRTVRREEKAAK